MIRNQSRLHIECGGRVLPSGTGQREIPSCIKRRDLGRITEDSKRARHVLSLRVLIVTTGWASRDGGTRAGDNRIL